MNDRDEFAKAALIGLLAAQADKAIPYSSEGGISDWNRLAKDAFDIAEAMVKRQFMLNLKGAP